MKKNNSAALRQLEIMKYSIKQYRESSISLASLISELESLFPLITSPNTQWSHDFQKQWAVLEEINAGILYDQREMLNTEEYAVTQESITQLERIIYSFTKIQDGI